MTASSTAYPEIEAKLVAHYAAKASAEVRKAVYDLVIPYFPPSHDDPFGHLPVSVNDALEAIHVEVFRAVHQLAREKLQRKLVEGMEALLNAD